MRKPTAAQMALLRKMAEWGWYVRRDFYDGRWRYDLVIRTDNGDEYETVDGRTVRGLVLRGWLDEYRDPADGGCAEHRITPEGRAATEGGE